MSQDGYLKPQCWCGSEQSAVFSPGYRQCSDCGTLFLATPLPKEHFEVSDDEGGFYGEKYWTQHVVEDYGLPHIESRTRTDLPERNLHWLRALLRYALPEERVLEVACAHGSFVGLLRQAGFDAVGLDVSPAILEYAHKVFDIPTIRGPVEDASIPPGSFRAIAAMDVLEHFTHPLNSMRRLADVLSDDGLFLIQTPCLKDPHESYEDLCSRNDRFLVHLKEDEHIYLFNQSSARDFFGRLGFCHTEFLDPIFDYDMFLAASRHPLPRRSNEDVCRALSAHVSRRIVLALLDLDDRRRDLYDKWQEAERDRAARLELIHASGAKLRTAANELAASEQDRAARLTAIEELATKLSLVEGGKADAEAQLESLKAAFAASEADRADRLTLIEDLSVRLAAAEADRAARLAVIEDVSARLASSEEDRAAHLHVIDTQSATIGDLESRIAATQEQIEAVERQLGAAIREIDAVRTRLSGTLVGRTLTATGWIRTPSRPGNDLPD